MNFLEFDWYLTNGSWDGEEGQTLVEYVMVLSIVSVALVGTLILLKVGVGAFYQEIIDAIAALT